MAGTEREEGWRVDEKRGRNVERGREGQFA